METALIAEAIKVWGVPGGVVIFVLVMAYKQLGSGGGSDLAQEMQRDILHIKASLSDLQTKVAILMDRSNR